MKAVSKLVKIKNNANPSTEYIEDELLKQGINPLRWAVVEVSEDFYTISVTNLVE